MNLESKITSFELSKKLYDLGWRIQTEFLWTKICHNWSINHYQEYLRKQAIVAKVIPAVLACELEKIIPERYCVRKYGIFYVPVKATDEGLHMFPSIKESTLANVYAVLLIYLTKNGYVEARAEGE